MSATSPPPSGIISLLTDFGLLDTYAGQMKAVMLGIAPGVAIVDLTHLVPPQDTVEGAFQLATAWLAFPVGTVHLAVVDPGVGTARRALAMLYAGHYFVAPDNGLLSLVASATGQAEVVVLDPARVSTGPLSGTFHGRDLFAPAAARLAGGCSLLELGDRMDPVELVRLELDPVARGVAVTSGPVVSIDRFGNCRTLIQQGDVPWAAQQVEVQCGATCVTGIRHAYGDVEAGLPLALFGSHGGLEIAVRNGNAAEALGIRRGDVVQVLLKPEE